MLWRCHLSLEQAQHMVYASERGDRPFRIVVSRGVIWRFTYLHFLHNAIFANKHMSLASLAAERIPRSWMVHKHSSGLCELSPGVAKESDDGPVYSLIFGPGTHHCAIVHAVDKHFINALCLQFSLLGQVTRNLLSGSAWSEGAWQSHDDYISPFRTLLHIHLADGIEALVNGDRRHLVSCLNRTDCSLE